MIDAKDLINIKEKPIKDDEVIDSLLENEDIRNFILGNNLTSDIVIQGMNILLEYQSDTVPKRDGKESLKYPGYIMVLTFKNGKISYTYKRKEGSLFPLGKIKSIAFPKEFMNASLEDFSLVAPGRRELYSYARMFENSFGSDKVEKGLYIAGPFRSGKTYLASAIGNDIARKGYSVIEVYYPELSQVLKASFSDDSFSDIVSDLKTCDLLILDDFGGEAVNPYIRDEALGITLQYRMVKNKPVIFTSNIAISKLADTSLRKDGSEQEKIKALRIVERIRELTKEFFLKDRFDTL
ncbi:MAG: ATP-binding protein [Bacillales bacterium]|nr:ATP-binding protein [Bacillales bacterium]